MIEHDWVERMFTIFAMLLGLAFQIEAGASVWRGSVFLRLGGEIKKFDEPGLFWAIVITVGAAGAIVTVLALRSWLS